MTDFARHPLMSIGASPAARACAPVSAVMTLKIITPTSEAGRTRAS